MDPNNSPTSATPLNLIGPGRVAAVSSRAVCSWLLLGFVVLCLLPAARVQFDDHSEVFRREGFRRFLFWLFSGWDGWLSRLATLGFGLIICAGVGERGSKLRRFCLWGLSLFSFAHFMLAVLMFTGIAVMGKVSGGEGQRKELIHLATLDALGAKAALEGALDTLKETVALTGYLEMALSDSPPHYRFKRFRFDTLKSLAKERADPVSQKRILASLGAIKSPGDEIVALSLAKKLSGERFNDWEEFRAWIDTKDKSDGWEPIPYFALRKVESNRGAARSD